MQKGTILTIDDDKNLQLVIEQYLEEDGYKVVTANDTKMALEVVSANNLDVILLDLVLPDGEGMALIPQLQAKSKAVIIVVSGKSDTTEKIVCLEMGADDYMTKPFEMRELSARIKAVLRRSEKAPNNNVSNDQGTADPQSKPEKIRFGDGWCLDCTQYQLFDKNSESCNLTTGEFKLLEALALSANRALSREHLFELTREGEFDAYDRAIDIQIGRLRKKLHDTDGQIIKTVRGVGYMFCEKITK